MKGDKMTFAGVQVRSPHHNPLKLEGYLGQSVQTPLGPNHNPEPTLI